MLDNNIISISILKKKRIQIGYNLQKTYYSYLKLKQFLHQNIYYILKITDAVFVSITFLVSILIYSKNQNLNLLQVKED